MKRVTVLAALIIALVGQCPTLAHEGEKHADLGAKPATASPAQAGQPESQFELKVVDASVKDPLLGGDSPPVEGEVQVTLRSTGWRSRVIKEEKAHKEKEEGVYGFHHTFDAAGNYLLDVEVKTSPQVVRATFPVTVTGPRQSPFRTPLIIVGGVLLLFAVFYLGRKSAPKSSRAAMMTTACVMFAWALGSATIGIAHEGEKHAELGAKSAAAPTAGAPIYTAKVGNPPKEMMKVRVGKYELTLTVKTEMPQAESLPPGTLVLDDATAKALGIQLATAERGTIAAPLTATGKVKATPNNMVKVGPFVSGRIAQVLVNVGERVAAGQTIAIVDSTDVAQAQAAWARAQANVEQAKRNLENVKRLAQSGALTQRPVDEARRERAQVASELAGLEVEVSNERASAESAAKTAEATLARTEAALKLAQQELERRRSLVAAGAVQYKPLEDARNEMAVANSEGRQSRAQLAFAKTQTLRAERLFSEGIMSKRELEAAQTAQAEAEAAVQRAEERVTIAQQALTREQKIFDERIYAQREIQEAETALQKAERDRDEAQAVLQQARRRVELANSATKANQIAQMRQRLETLNNMLQREQTVAGQRLLATKELVQAQGEYDKALTELRGAEVALRLLRARAQTPSGPAVGVPITAPISGIIAERPVNRGETVKPEDTIASILNLNTVWLEMDVFESDLPRVKIGTLAQVTTASYPDKIFSGFITYIASTVKPDSRTVDVRTEVANPAGLLKPDMFATAELVVGKVSNVITVPKRAILDDGGLKVLFVFKDGKYQRRVVFTGAATFDRVEIKDGVDAGEKVVVQGAYELKAALAKGQ